MPDVAYILPPSVPQQLSQRCLTFLQLAEPAVWHFLKPFDSILPLAWSAFPFYNLQTRWCHSVTKTHNDVIMSPKPTMMSSCHPNPQWCHHVTQTHSCPSCCSSWAVCCRSFTSPTHQVWGAFLFSSLQTKRCMMSPKTAVIFHITVLDLQSLWCLHLMHLAKCHLKCHLSHDGSGFTVPVVPSPSAPCHLAKCHLKPLSSFTL